MNHIYIILRLINDFHIISLQTYLKFLVNLIVDICLKKLFLGNIVFCTLPGMCKYMTKVDN